MYDHHTLKSQLTENTDEQLGVTDIIVRAKSVLPLMDKLYVCCGFLTSGIDESLELYEVNVEKHFITQLQTSGGITEERFFSLECKVFTNSAELICSRCNEKKVL